MATSQRATAWSVTINNPTDSDEINIASARQRGWKVEGQLEQGTHGTPHYQLLIQTPQVRFSALKKAFPRSHIEVARNLSALKQYVQKEETRVGTLQVDQSFYPCLSKLWDLFYEYIEESDNMMAKESWNEEEWLRQFDFCIKDLICDGYHVESMAVNPQVRGCVKKYGREIIIRSQNIRRQTDRQTDKNVFPVIENGSETSCSSVQEEGSVSSARSEDGYETPRADD